MNKTLKQKSRARWVPLLAIFTLTTQRVLAHPGHDFGDFGWKHQVVSVDHALPLLLVGLLLALGSWMAPRGGARLALRVGGWACLAAAFICAGS